MKRFLSTALLTFGIALMTFSGSTVAVDVKGEHFLCYKVSDFSGFEPEKVELRDQFQRFGTGVLKPTLLCNSVQKNSEPIVDPNRHLVCYTIEPQKPRDISVLVSNQFDDGQKIFVKEPAILCVPSLKKLP